MKIGVLGLGFMGSTHLKALATIPGAELVAVMDLDEKRLSGDLSGIQGNIGGPGENMDFSRVRKYRTVEEALNDPELEAVDICLPTFLHAPVALQALQAGKHVLVEKPMALDGAAADQMIAEAEKHKRILMTAQVLRFVASYRKLSELVKSGSLGVVRSAIFRRRCAAPTWGPWEFDSSKSGGGIFDLLIHDVDICLHLFGVPEAVSALGYEDLPRGIDHIAAQFHYPEIGSITIAGGWHHIGQYPFSMEYTVIADGGTVEYNSAGRPPALYRADGKMEELKSADGDWYREEVAYFVECCLAERKPQLCPPEESALAVKVTRLMIESRRRGGEKLSCTPR
jgi:predicted dehydrogenase